jgi:hypothetical protein
VGFCADMHAKVYISSYESAHTSRFNSQSAVSSQSVHHLASLLVLVPATMVPELSSNLLRYMSTVVPL